MPPDTRKALLAIGLAAFVVAACGEIAGLRDPDVIEGNVTPGGSDGEAPSADDVEITPASVELGAVACGASSPGGKTVVIKNRGKTSPKYTVQVPEGSPFEVTGAPLTGELARDATITLEVKAKPTTPGDTEADLVVTAGTIVSQIKTKVAGEGARLEIAPAMANLGSVRDDNGGSLDVAVTNTGNKAATLAKIDSSSDQYSATWSGHPAPLAIEPGATATVKVTLAPGDEMAQKLAATLTLGVDGAHCGAVPSLPVEGQRVNQDVTISPVDFGNQLCNTSPAITRDVVISNFSGSTLAYNATLVNGAASAFTISGGASGTIGGGTSATPTTQAVTLTMKPVGQNLGAIAEKVQVEITGIGPPSGGIRQTDATSSVRGVIFNVTPSNSTNYVRYETRTFAFTNSGNEDYTLSGYFIRDPGTTQRTAWWFSFPVTVSAGQTRNVNVQFDPGYQNYGTYAGTFGFQKAVSSTIPVCNGTPSFHVHGRY